LEEISAEFYSKKLKKIMIGDGSDNEKIILELFLRNLVYKF
jgi:hypothetical protein